MYLGQRVLDVLFELASVRVNRKKQSRHGNSAPTEDINFEILFLLMVINNI